MTRFLQDLAMQDQKNPFVFNGRLFGFANFSKFIFGEKGDINGLRAKKFGIIVFWISELLLRLRLTGLPIIRKPT
jgi:hypothetical protein